MGPNRLIYVVMAAAVVACCLLVEHVEGVAAATVTSSAGVTTRRPPAVTGHSKHATSHSPSHVSMAPTRLAGATRLNTASGLTIRAPAPRTRGLKVRAANSPLEAPKSLPGDLTSLALGTFEEVEKAWAQASSKNERNLLEEAMRELVVKAVVRPPNSQVEAPTGLAADAEQIAAIKLEGLEAMKEAYVAECLLRGNERTKKMQLLEWAVLQLVAEAVEAMEKEGLDLVHEEFKAELALREKKAILETVKSQGSEAYTKAQVEVLEAERKALLLQVAVSKQGGFEEVKKAYVNESERLFEENEQHSQRPEIEVTKKMLLLKKAIQQLVAEAVKAIEENGPEAVNNELEKAKENEQERKRSKSEKKKLDALNEEFKAVLAARKKKGQLGMEKDPAADKGSASQSSSSGWTPAKEESAKEYVETVKAERMVQLLKVAAIKLQGLEAVREELVKASIRYMSPDEIELLEEAMRELVAQDVGSKVKEALEGISVEAMKAKALEVVRRELWGTRVNKFGKNLNKKILPYANGSYADHNRVDADLKEAEIREQVLIQAEQRLK